MNGPSAAATAKRGVVRFLRDGGDRRAARCAGARAVGSAHNRKPILTDGSRWPFRPPCWQRSAIGPERTIEKTRLMSLSGGVPGGRMERRQFLQTMGFGATALLLMTLTSSISCGAVSSTK